MLKGQSKQHSKERSRAPTSSAANLSTAVKGASSGTLKTLNGSLGSDVSTTLKVTFACALRVGGKELRFERHVRDEQAAFLRLSSVRSTIQGVSRRRLHGADRCEKIN